MGDPENRPDGELDHEGDEFRQRTEGQATESGSDLGDHSDGNPNDGWGNPDPGADFQPPPPVVEGFDQNADDLHDPAYFRHEPHMEVRFRPTDVEQPYAAFEFIYLPTSENTVAYSKALTIIKQSIYDYGLRHHYAECDPLWDAPCDVNVEWGGLNIIFGREGVATKDLDRGMVERFSVAITNLPDLRHRVAHPVVARHGNASVQYVCKHISYAITMARLLHDDSARQNLDQLVEQLQSRAREERLFVETHQTIAGLPEHYNGWPRHHERLFDMVVNVHAAYIEEPSPNSELNVWNAEWMNHYQWKRVPLVVRTAALEWSEFHDGPGFKKPAAFAEVLA